MPSCYLYFQDVTSFGGFVTGSTLATQSRHEIRAPGRTVSALGLATFGPAWGGKLRPANGMIKSFCPVHEFLRLPGRPCVTQQL